MTESGNISIGETRVYQQVNFDPNDRIRFDRIGYVMLERTPRNPPPVRTKADFYRRFHAGEFGNHGPMWATLEEWKKSGYDKPIAIRTMKPGGRCDYDIQKGQVAERTADFILQGWRELNYSAMSPHDCNAIQGEICQLPSGIHLFASTAVELPMRPALATAGRHWNGATAVAVLRHFMDASSYEWMWHLLDSYPGHVLEFTTFTRPYGVIRGMNTVWWEVRLY